MSLFRSFFMNYLLILVTDGGIVTRNFLVLFFVLLGVGCTPQCERSPFEPARPLQEPPPDFKVESIESGDGPSLSEGDTLTVHYRAWIYHKSESDSKGPLVNDTYALGKPQEINFGQDELIEGWAQGLRNTHAGDKIRLYVPAAMAYGTDGAGTSIPQGAHLIYEIEILSIKKNP